MTTEADNANNFASNIENESGLEMDKDSTRTLRRESLDNDVQQQEQPQLLREQPTHWQSSFETETGNTDATTEGRKDHDENVRMAAMNLLDRLATPSAEQVTDPDIAAGPSTVDIQNPFDLFYFPEKELSSTFYLPQTLPATSTAITPKAVDKEDGVLIVPSSVTEDVYEYYNLALQPSSDVTSICTADFLKVPLVRQRTGSDGDSALTQHHANRSRAVPQLEIEPSTSSDVSSSLGFDPEKYSYDEDDPASENNQVGPNGLVSNILPGLREEEGSEADLSIPVSLAASEDAASDDALAPTSSAQDARPADRDVANLSRKSSGVSSDDGDDDDNSQRLMFPTTTYLANNIKSHSTDLSDSEVYMTESEEAQESSELMKSPSPVQAKSPTSMLAPVYSSSEDGEDPEIDFFVTDDTVDNSNSDMASAFLSSAASLSFPEEHPTNIDFIEDGTFPSQAAIAATPLVTPLPLKGDTVRDDKGNNNIVSDNITIPDGDSFDDEENSIALRVVAGPHSVTTSRAHEDEDDAEEAGKVAVSAPKECLPRKFRLVALLCLGVLLLIGIVLMIYFLVAGAHTNKDSAQTLPETTTPPLTTTPPVTTPPMTTLPVTAPPFSTQPVTAPTPALTTTSVPSHVQGSVSPLPTTLENTDLFQLLVNVSFDGGAALSNQSSPQYRAFQWLAGNANIVKYDAAKRISRYVLATLYYSTGGNSTWLKEDLWLSDADECDWFTQARSRPCSDSGQFQILQVSYNNLEGSLPPELGILSSSLVTVNMAGGPTKFLGGSLPPELGHLSLVQDLRLPNNVFTGSLPTAIGGWIGMRTIDLSGNKFRGEIPNEIGAISALISLSVDNNKFEGTLPTTLGSLTLLKTLSLASNRLTSIPSEVGLLTVLALMDLNDNAFQGTLTSEVGLARELRTLTMARNNLSGQIPSELGFLSKLTVLDLSDNSFNGTIPSELGTSSNASLISNKLRSLSLNGNFLVGTVPESFVNLQRLQTLMLQSNYLLGSMPSVVCDRFNMTLVTVYVDCEEVDCPCCNFCCVDGSGCECRYLNSTDNSWLCF